MSFPSSASKNHQEAGSLLPENGSDVFLRNLCWLSGLHGVISQKIVLFILKKRVPIGRIPESLRFELRSFISWRDVSLPERNAACRLLYP
jgi:hypothetical protein